MFIYPTMVSVLCFVFVAMDLMLLLENRENQINSTAALRFSFESCMRGFLYKIRKNFQLTL